MSDFNDNTTWFEVASANSAPGLFPEGMSPSSVNDNLREFCAATKRFYDRINATVTSTGTANDYQIAYNVAPTNLVVGDTYAFFPHVANGAGPATLTINALPTKPITSGGHVLNGREMLLGVPAVVTYDGTGFQLLNSQGIFWNDIKTSGNLTVAGSAFFGNAQANNFSATNGTFSNNIAAQQGEITTFTAVTGNFTNLNVPNLNVNGAVAVQNDIVTTTGNFIGNNITIFGGILVPSVLQVLGSQAVRGFITAGTTIGATTSIASGTSMSCGTSMTVGNDLTIGAILTAPTMNCSGTFNGTEINTNNLRCAGLITATSAAITGTISTAQVFAVGLNASGIMQAPQVNCTNAFMTGSCNAVDLVASHDVICDTGISTNGWFVNQNGLVKAYMNHIGSAVIMANATSGSYVRVDDDGAIAVGYNPTNQSLAYNPTVNPGWVAVSDVRVKRDVEDLPNMLDKINELRPVSYKMKAEANGQSHMGFIAQEVKEILPKLVSKPTRYADSEIDIDDAIGLDYANFVVPLVKAVQELTKRVQELEGNKMNVVKKILKSKPSAKKMPMKASMSIDKKAGGFDHDDSMKNHTDPNKKC